MPVKVKIQIVIAIALAALVIFAFSAVSLVASALLTIIAILYVEMIYPRWNFFGDAILDVKDRGPHAVAITFDDGPSEWTAKILDVLRDEKVKATFFLLGINVERHPAIAARIQNEGHTIGYHGYSHTKFHWRGRGFIHEDLNRCAAAFKSAGLNPAPIIRFPHGVKNFFAVREAKNRNLEICSWGRGVWDSKRPGVQIIVERSLRLKEGEILLLHDGDGANANVDRSQTAEALPQIIKGLKQKSFTFTSLK